jgi:hypothetical protein
MSSLPNEYYQYRKGTYTYKFEGVMPANPTDIDTICEEIRWSLTLELAAMEAVNPIAELARKEPDSVEVESRGNNCVFVSSPVGKQYMSIDFWLAALKRASGKK